MGDNSSDLPTFSACPQSTPLVAVRVAINWLAMPDANDGADQRV